MNNRGLLKIQMIAYFLLSGTLVLGAPIWRKRLTDGTMGWSGWALTGYLISMIAAVVFFWAALRIRSRLRTLS
jgi:hypothetical protein